MTPPAMTTDELDEIMERLERMWPASKFRDLEEIEIWREHLGKHPHDAVAQVLATFMSSGQYRRFRPDLPPILEALGVHGRAVARATRAGQGFRVLPPDITIEDEQLAADAREAPDLSTECPIDRSIENARALRDRLRSKSSA